MKKLLQLLLCLLSLTAFAQASGSQEVAFKVRFEKDIQVKDIKVYYTMGGSSFEWIQFEANSADNSISITGYNHYVVGVGIPTFVFVQEEPYIDPYSENKLNQEKVTKVNCYYLYGGWRCAIDRVPDILFAKKYPNISLTRFSEKPVLTRDGDDIFIKREGIGNTLLRVNPKLRE